MSDRSAGAEPVKVGWTRGRVFLPVIVVLWIAVIVALTRVADPPAASGWCDSSPCNCSTPSPDPGPNGGQCDYVCLGPGDPGCSCYGGTRSGDCGGGGGCTPSCTNKFCGASDGCGGTCDAGLNPDDGICCPSERIGKAGYSCQDCSACGNWKHFAAGTKAANPSKVGCFCDDVNCPVGGRPIHNGTQP